MAYQHDEPAYEPAYQHDERSACQLARETASYKMREVLHCPGQDMMTRRSCRLMDPEYKATFEPNLQRWYYWRRGSKPENCESMWQFPANPYAGASLLCGGMKGELTSFFGRIASLQQSRVFSAYLAVYISIATQSRQVAKQMSYIGACCSKGGGQVDVGNRAMSLVWCALGSAKPLDGDDAAQLQVYTMLPELIWFVHRKWPSTDDEHHSNNAYSMKGDIIESILGIFRTVDTPCGPTCAEITQFHDSIENACFSAKRICAEVPPDAVTSAVLKAASVARQAHAMAGPKNRKGSKKLEDRWRNHSKELQQCFFPMRNTM